MFWGYGMIRALAWGMLIVLTAAIPVLRAEEAIAQVAAEAERSAEKAARKAARPARRPESADAKPVKQDA